MWFWIGIYLSVSLVSCSGLIVITMLSGHLKEMESEMKIEQIYLSAITWQKMLERGEREKVLDLFKVHKMRRRQLPSHLTDPFVDAKFYADVGGRCSCICLHAMVR